MLRVFLAILGVMVLMCAGGAVLAKQQIIPFKTWAAFEPSDKAAMWMAQNNGEGNRQQRCRRDKPPLSS